jgi:hypothetical protein
MMKPIKDWMEQKGAPWIFSVKDPEALMEGYGWEAKVSVVGDQTANYGRWPYPSVPRTIPGVPRTYYISARRAERVKSGT